VGANPIEGSSVAGIVCLTPVGQNEAELQHPSPHRFVGDVELIFEDLHWIDPTSREFLDLALARIDRLPILLVATFRPEFQPPWTGQPHVTVMSLNRLLGAARAGARSRPRARGQAVTRVRARNQ
jgi:hypothetical protein